MKSPDFSIQIPSDDDRERHICNTCGFIDYINPKIVAGSVITDPNGQIILARRAIEPRIGYWTLPAGYMEEGESVEDAARREAMEEACAKIKLTGLIGIYSIPRISQVQIFFRAQLMDDHIAAGPESQAVERYRFEDIDDRTLAFPSVRWALDDFKASQSVDQPIPVMRTQTIRPSELDER